MKEEVESVYLKDDTSFKKNVKQEQARRHLNNTTAFSIRYVNVPNSPLVIGHSGDFGIRSSDFGFQRE